MVECRTLRWSVQLTNVQTTQILHLRQRGYRVDHSNSQCNCTRLIQLIYFAKIVHVSVLQWHRNKSALWVCQRWVWNKSDPCSWSKTKEEAREQDYGKNRAIWREDTDMHEITSDFLRSRHTFPVAFDSVTIQLPYSRWNHWLEHSNYTS